MSTKEVKHEFLVYLNVQGEKKNKNNAFLSTKMSFKNSFRLYNKQWETQESTSWREIFGASWIGSGLLLLASVIGSPAELTSSTLSSSVRITLL